MNMMIRQSWLPARIMIMIAINGKGMTNIRREMLIYILCRCCLTWRPAPPWIVVMVMTFEKNPMVMMIIKMKLVMAIITDRLRHPW